MIVKRYCGHERLPGGERLWRRLARAVGFDGEVLVYGYGVGGSPGRQHRRAMRTGYEKGVVLGDYEPKIIRVWIACSCASAEFDSDALRRDNDDPLAIFAHELGHHVQRTRGKRFKYATADREEAVATRYGRMLLRSVA